MGLNIILTTIKCPTKLSHFRDRWDTWDAGQNCDAFLYLLPFSSSIRNSAFSSGRSSS